MSTHINNICVFFLCKYEYLVIVSAGFDNPFASNEIYTHFNRTYKTKALNRRFKLICSTGKNIESDLHAPDVCFGNNIYRMVSYPLFSISLKVILSSSIPLSLCLFMSNPILSNKCSMGVFSLKTSAVKPDSPPFLAR